MLGQEYGEHSMAGWGRSFAKKVLIRKCLGPSIDATTNPYTVRFCSGKAEGAVLDLLCAAWQVALGLLAQLSSLTSNSATEVGSVPWTVGDTCTFWKHFGNNPLPDPYTLPLFPKWQSHMNPVEELYVRVHATAVKLVIDICGHKWVWHTEAGVSFYFLIR